jgi:hypothetical protein
MILTMDPVAVAGVIVAIVGLVIGLPIAFKQLRLSRNLERVKVYGAVRNYLNAASQLGRVPDEIERAFHEATEDMRVHLLFEDNDPRAYIAELRWKANELRRLGALEADLPSGEKKSSVTLKRLHLVQWMERQRASRLEERLGKHL